MKTIFLLSALFVTVLSSPEETYDLSLEQFGAEQLIDDVIVLKNFAKCFLDEGPCTPDAKKIKKVIPDAIKTTCAKCSHKQRELIRIIVKEFQTKLPEMWKQLQQKEDPTGEYTPAFAEFLKRTD